MASNRITEGVGKKIVEALKQQSDIEITPVNSDNNEVVFNNPDFETENIATHTEEETILHNMDEPVMPSFNFGQKKEENLTSMNELQTGAVDDMELPANVAVLKQLIAKLPSGVSKQTGAQIIKQTMEALGISMAGVLQEAQQVQESLNQSARDCQNNILEYKKQINVLEAQAHKYQKQFSVVNDIISLFIQTNN
ncbi:unknown [Brachyspira sp. CAG:484]|nr:unknown [Brachyspira sp. CAG:484]